MILCAISSAQTTEQASAWATAQSTVLRRALSSAQSGVISLATPKRRAASINCAVLVFPVKGAGNSSGKAGVERLTDEDRVEGNQELDASLRIVER